MPIAREPLPGHTLHTLALEIDALADRVEEIGARTVTAEKAQS